MVSQEEKPHGHSACTPKVQDKMTKGGQSHITLIHQDIPPNLQPLNS